VILTDPPAEPRKFYIDGGEVEVIGHLVYDLDTDGKKLQVVKYTEYSGRAVRTLYPTRDALQSAWANPDTRADVLRELTERGISFEELAASSDQPDADPFDLLCHLAWNAPLLTRRQRAERRARPRKTCSPVRRHGPRNPVAAARQVRRARHHAIQRLSELMKVQPFDRYGSPSEIATRHFGGVRAFEGRRLAAADRALPMTDEPLPECLPKPAPPTPQRRPARAQGQGAADHAREPVGADRQRPPDPAQGQGAQWRRGSLPLLTWVMFLKFLDDLEVVHEEEAELDGKPYQPIIEAPYRWRDWAAREDGITGDELLAFIGQDECHARRRQRGKGLFAYLRGLAARARRAASAKSSPTCFKGVQNRMVSGYLLRDIINKINGIHFSASEEIHTLSHLYESMLREMRDAAGDSGEFYTPRPVVRFMVQVTDPRLGETVLDPACGTGGFLVEAYDHIAPQVSTPDQRRALQRDTLFGQEAKPLPYMLAQMNLLLHGLEAPQIAYGNTLDRRINEIGHSERVDVILTNPPFGGEEEVGIKANFPPNMQTAETALLFLQYIMRKLRVAGAPVPGGKPATRGGRAAVVVPNGTCSATASAPSSRRNCSRSSACTPSCACRKACSRPTPTFRPTCCSSSAAARPTPSGTTSCPCPKAARSTARPRRCSSRSSRRRGPGGTTAKKARRPGRWTSPPGALPPWKPPRPTGSEPRPNAMRRWPWASRIRELEQAISAAANGDEGRAAGQAARAEGEQQAHEQAPRPRRPRAMRCTGRSTTWTSRTRTPRRAGARRPEGPDRLDAQPRGRGDAPAG
jgi:type I restriction enzyme M protein